MRRVFAIVAGLALAIPAGLVSLFLTVAFLVSTAPGARPGSSMLALMVALAWSDDPQRLLGTAVRAAGETLAVTTCAPVICAALIGEVAELGGLVWYAGATAAFGVALPLAAAGTGLLAIPSQPSAWSPLLMAGAVAGTVYWAVGGRGVSTAARRQARFDLASSRKSASETHEA